MVSVVESIKNVINKVSCKDIFRPERSAYGGESNG